MSASMYRRQLEQKRKQRRDAESKVGNYRTKESTARAAAAKARGAAAATKSLTTTKSKLREAERKDKEAETAGKDAAQRQKRVDSYSKQELNLQAKLERAQQSELEAAERKRKKAEEEAARRAAGERQAFNSRLSQAEDAVNEVMRSVPSPKAEVLRILLLGAASEGDLRIGREQKRIRTAVEAALHRDQIQFDARPAATTADLMDGITKFRPHVVHFSGHSSSALIVFEGDRDEQHDGVIVTAQAFARAMQATDSPPLLVLLNSCNSAPQANNLVEEKIVPLAIGMADSIADTDAINYAAQFYAAIANGHSVHSSHLAARVSLELDGLEGYELPTLASADGIDPAKVVLVKPTE
ncbi:CHAT domain-containing protein [Dietzia cercidiphylli]|uniref:CHAT domain-containing protein n=1 Tax=Dietzia cercidiphylli TaxID=498199 RepID=UPI00223B39AC|nr:CHAT domain-containing protein [Dietzia cercidiphylli]MCT1514048.1 CHAT domain-containing protein [Dietzia cercidiphylli]